MSNYLILKTKNISYITAYPFPILSNKGEINNGMEK